MKLFLATLLLTAVAQATPAVGDYNDFKYTYVTGDDLLVGSFMRTVVAENENSVAVVETARFDSREDVRVEKVFNKSDMMTDKSIEAWLRKCEPWGGQKELVFVPAGVYDTCKTSLKENGVEVGTVWYGQVPFGIVKQIQHKADGTYFSLELRSFLAGGQQP